MRNYFYKMKYFILGLLLLFSCASHQNTILQKEKNLDKAINAYLNFNIDNYFEKRVESSHKFLINQKINPITKVLSKQVKDGDACAYCLLNKMETESIKRDWNIKIPTEVPFQFKNEKTDKAYYNEAEKLIFHPLMQGKERNTFCLAISSDTNPEWEEEWGEIVLLRKNSLGKMEVVKSLFGYVAWF